MDAYRVKNGVVWCAGKRVPADRIVMLTRAQALHAPVDAHETALETALETQSAEPKQAEQSAKPSPKPRRRAITPPDLADGDLGDGDVADDDLGSNAPKGAAR